MILCFAALLVPQQTRAAKVVITVTGTVGIGVDTSGVFGPPDSSLLGEPFTLVFTVDDTAGVQNTANCPNGLPYSSSITSTATSNPATAVLTIGSGSFTFGVSSGPSSAILLDIPNCFDVASLIYLGVDDVATGVNNSVGGYVYPTPGTVLTTNISWEAPFSNANIFSDLGFSILETGPPIQWASGILNAQTINNSGPLATGPPDKTLGDCEPCKGNHPGLISTGDPITIGTGNLFEQATDYITAGANPLAFTRFYNSLQAVSNPGTFATTLGTNWRSTYDRYIQTTAAGNVAAERGDGQVLAFKSGGAGWTGDTDINVTLTKTREPPPSSPTCSPIPARSSSSTPKARTHKSPPPAVASAMPAGKSPAWGKRSMSSIPGA
jgi:hypothetical protein